MDCSFENDKLAEATLWKIMALCLMSPEIAQMTLRMAVDVIISLSPTDNQVVPKRKRKTKKEVK